MVQGCDAIKSMKNSSDPQVPVRLQKKTSFLGDVFRLALGTAFAQGLSVLAIPILTRLYSPAAFGVWGIFLSISTIIGVVICLRYELAIMLPEIEEEAVNLLAICCVFVLVVSLMMIPVVMVGKDQIGKLLNAPDLTDCLWLLPLNLLVNGLALAFNYWNTRTKHFSRMAFVLAINQIVTLASKLIFGFWGYTRIGLIVGDVAGNVAAVIVLGACISKDEYRLFFSSVSWAQIGYSVKRYRNFPIFTTWSSLLGTVSMQIPSVLLSSFFSASVSGLYSIGNRVLQNPLSIITNSIARVFFQRSSEANQQGGLSELVESTFKQLTAFGLFPLLVLVMIGQNLFVIFLGPAYAEAGVYIQIISIGVFFWFISGVFGNLLFTLERQVLGLRIDIALFVLRLLSLVLGGVLQNARLAILLYSFSSAVGYGYLLYRTMTLSHVPLSHVFRILLQNLLIFSPAGIILFGLRFITANNYIISGAGILMTGIYFVYYFLTDPQMMTLARKVIHVPPVEINS
jgi:lipopolysaccharide exporter